LAEGYLRAGNLTTARQRYEQILKAEGEDANVLNNLANILARQNDPGAIDLARRAYKAMPEDPGVLDTLGWLLIQSGSLDSGLKHLREARVRAPGNPEIRYHLAAALARTGRKAEAREELDAVLAEHPAFEESEAARQLLRSLAES
jgi:Flp pilus assembly protein TadD